ncbi:cellulase family glycosylhydrolase [Rubrivirga marina]|uniref:CBM6 domain-containing protein n=1 Tax=Rubrivirga marina TaxID=1196024 RepID=A0A271J0V6_9BACT|nr:cellulase family glycosylhydrolase [Rubrivirga marina]PAP77136.1 hypothetical protein BSZ37_12210 [Rubrivirga marina]
MLRSLALVLLFAAPVLAQGDGFFRASDGQILDGSGEPVVIRGVGLGGWLVPEGYMLHISAPDGGSPRSIRAQIVDLIGEDGADEFFEVYRANYVEQKDIDQIAAWGYDHVRLPFHYLDFWDPETETIREEGFQIVDDLLAWCRPHGLEVVLDMHAAPGAQNAGNISDSDGTARLWTEPDPYQDWVVEIWTAIAERYADETLIMGYDLINEPVLPDGIPGSDLRDLYARLAEAIREVDPNHLLFIEGNFYATDFSALEEPVDDNMVYAFHKYWSSVGQPSIQYLLDLRAETGVPLWLGETGENSNPWFYAVRRLAEANGIGWNWWTHKKIETLSAPASAPFAPGYEALVRYWQGNGGRPSAEAARAALLAMANGLDLDRTTRNEGVIAALFDDSFGTTPRPFRTHRIPGTIHAVDYDLGDQGVAYSDADPWAISGTPGGGNTGGAYRNDGVDIERSTDPQGAAYNVGWVETLEWLRYTATVEEAGRYDVEIRVASGGTGGRLALDVDGASLGTVTVPGTGGWQSWRSVTLPGVAIPAGEHAIRVTVRSGEFNINQMRFIRVGDTAVEGEPAVLGVRIAPNPAVRSATLSLTLPASGDVSVVVFDALGRLAAVTEAGRLGAGEREIDLPLRGLAPGIYLVRVTVGDAAVTQQLVVHR